MIKKNKYMTLVTEVGRAKIMRATQTGKKLNLTTIKLGDGNGGSYDINEKQTRLKNVVYENSISSYSIDPVNDNILYIEAIIGSSVGPFWIREFGVFDDEGDLIIIGNYEETYKAVAQEGSTMELYIKIAVILSNMDSVEIKVDPSVLLASKEELERAYKLIGDLGTGSELFKTTESCAAMLLELKNDLTDYAKKTDIPSTTNNIINQNGGENIKLWIGKEDDHKKVHVIDPNTLYFVKE